MAHKRRKVKTHKAELTPVADTKPEVVKIDDAVRLREIRHCSNRTIVQS